MFIGLTLNLKVIDAKEMGFDIKWPKDANGEYTFVACEDIRL